MCLCVSSVGKANGTTKLLLLFVCKRRIRFMISISTLESKKGSLLIDEKANYQMLKLSVIINFA